MSHTLLELSTPEASTPKDRDKTRSTIAVSVGEIAEPSTLGSTETAELPCCATRSRRPDPTQTRKIDFFIFDKKSEIKKHTVNSAH